MINLNDAFIEELFFQYLRDKNSVSPEWRNYFDSKGTEDSLQNKKISLTNKLEADKPTSALKQDNGSAIVKEGEITEPLGSIQMRISANMESSLEVPTATSVRTIPVKVLDENRRIINKYLTKLKRPKVSFTHILLWAIVKSLIKYPNMNDSYALIEGVPSRIRRKSVNIGLAVDIVRKDGSRLLLVPNVKDVQNMNFSEFIEAFDVIIDKARLNKIMPEDLVGTTVTLTNPGMIGTTFSSPRLMKGQGLIIATGSIDYPTEFQAVSPEILTNLAVSKVVTITSTYDHRIIQGAESAEFLAYLNKLLVGNDMFYDQIFVSLKIPFEPVKWSVDKSKSNLFSLNDPREIMEKGAHVMQMINAYRVRGHLLASVNPLGMITYYYPELDPAYYGFTIWDLDRTFHADDSWEKNNLPLREIIELLRETYCGPIGIEYMHMQFSDRKEWIKRRVERARSEFNFSREEKLHIYHKLVDAEIFENFLHTKFVGHKRFSLEGSESVIVGIDKIFELAANAGLNSITLGMAHRGRLNVLVNNIGKKYETVFEEFEESFERDSYHGSGDVKYHLGDWGIYISSMNKSISVILAPNPSHLELVNPVIEGMARALNNEIKDPTYTKVLPILIHGDAAFAGQGIVAETLNLSQLEGYKTGGTIHIIINNQIGFTTSSTDARSSYYASDVAKMIQSPIIHVNGNNPEAVVAAAALAFEYRNKFNSDIVIDILSYRKYGHNEADEPTYTQPLLYKKIKQMVPVRDIFEKELLSDKVINNDDVDQIISEKRKKLNDAYAARSKKVQSIPHANQYLLGQLLEKVDTSVSEDRLNLIIQKITAPPPTFNINPKVSALLKKRNDMFYSKEPAIDWALAESLAFGSILLDGKEIRFSGQDSRRGTFSQRHAVLTDIINEDECILLNSISPDQSVLRIFDSPLSEVAVLGFEYGYSVIALNSLTLWEAQFGDFFNGAQAMIDQFIISAEAKWGQTSNLVMLLPHSYDGQGPEHSSARLERFLQSAAQENIIVGNFTTPANYFHSLRRQTLMTYRKPMILMTPKSMLRNQLAVSSVRDLTDKVFEPIIDDNHVQNPDDVKRIILCSGKFYYELHLERQKLKLNDVAIIRIEQLYPLDKPLLSSIMAKYGNAGIYVWAQEEPENMGAWRFISPNIYQVMTSKAQLFYAGRPESASPATGSHRFHDEEQALILNQAFTEYIF